MSYSRENIWLYVFFLISVFINYAHIYSSSSLYINLTAAFPLNAALHNTQAGSESMDSTTCEWSSALEQHQTLTATYRNIYPYFPRSSSENPFIGKIPYIGVQTEHTNC